MNENKRKEFIEVEKSLYNLDNGDALIKSPDDFQDFIFKRAQEIGKESTEDENTDELFSVSDSSVKDLKKRISLIAKNNFFEMFFNSYMANSNSDLRFRLGQYKSVVNESKNINTAVNFKKEFTVDTKNLDKIKIEPQRVIGYFFPPFMETEKADEDSGISKYRKWDEAHQQWVYINDSKAEDFFDTKKRLLKSKSFTYRGNSFKSVNDNIILLQRMLEHTTGVVSTYLTEWDVSLYLQGGIINADQVEASKNPAIGLLYRILQDNPSKYNNIKALTWGALNAGISKISACSGIVNPPMYRFNPADFPFSSNWSPYSSFNRGDGLDVFYNIANQEIDNPKGFQVDRENALCSFRLSNKKYDDLTFREKLYYWDCKGAAYCGWYSWRNLRYYNVIYTTPEDGVSDIDMVHSTENSVDYNWHQLNEKDEKNGIIPRIIQTLYNNDDSLGYELDHWKENICFVNGGQEYWFYIKSPKTGKPVLLARYFLEDNQPIDKGTWFDHWGGEFRGYTREENEEIFEYFDNKSKLDNSGKSLSSLLTDKVAGKFLFSKVCMDWPEVKNTYGSTCPSNQDIMAPDLTENTASVMVKQQESGVAASLTSSDEEDSTLDTCSSGVPKWNPFLYGGPHGKDISPFVVSSLFQKDSHILRNVPRVSPVSKINDEFQGVEAFYEYGGNGINENEIPKIGNARSPSSTLNLIKNGDIPIHPKKVERYVEYKEFLPFKEKWRIKDCKTEWYYEPRYTKLGDSRDKKGKDTVSYSGGQVSLGDVIEHTGFFSPSSNPTKSNFNLYREYSKGTTYDTLAYEWATYYRYASSGTTYYKGNSRRATLKYPVTPPVASSTVNTYGNVSTSSNQVYNTSASIGNQSSVYGGAALDGNINWQYKESTGTFYELLCTYRAYGKLGTWHRWESYYVNTPIMQANLEDIWQIDAIETREYSTEETKKSKVKNTILGILTLGISTLFTTKDVRASSSTPSTKYRLVLGRQQKATSEVLTSNDGSFQIITDVEKKFKANVFDDEKDTSWKPCYFFVNDTLNDFKTKGPFAIFKLHVRRAFYQYVETTSSTNKVGCESKTTTTDTVKKAEFIEVYNGNITDSDYNKLRPRIFTSFNEAFMKNENREIFEPKSFDISNIEGLKPTEKNIYHFVNNIFDVHKSTDAAGGMSPETQILYLIGQTEEQMKQAELQEIGTYGFGFSTYLPGIFAGENLDSGFKAKVNLQVQSKVARINQKAWAYKYKYEEWSKILLWESKGTEERVIGTRPVVDSNNNPVLDENGHQVYEDIVEKFYVYRNKKTGDYDRSVKVGGDISVFKTAKRYTSDECKAEAKRFSEECYDNYKLADKKPFSELFSGIGAIDGTSSPSLEKFTCPIEFWNSDDTDGKSFTKAKGNDAVKTALNKALLGYYSTSTFFKENEDTTDGTITNCISPYIVSNSVPYLIIYSCISLQKSWTEFAKEYMLSTYSTNLRDIIKRAVNKKIQIASGVENEEEINKNSVDYNPWIQMAYSLATEDSKNNIEENFDKIIQALDIFQTDMKDSINLNAGYTNWCLSDIETFKEKIVTLENWCNNGERFEEIFNYIYSYLNVLYEYRKFFLFKRCNKQDGTLFNVRCLEQATPLVSSAAFGNEKEDPLDDMGDGKFHKYDVAFTQVQNTNNKKVEAMINENTWLSQDKITKIFIKINYFKTEDKEIQDFIKYYNEHDGKIPTTMQRYVYVPDVDKWAEVPFDDRYILKSSQYYTEKRKINEANRSETPSIATLDSDFLSKENGKTIVPFEIKKYIQNIKWVDETKKDKMYNLIKSVKISDDNKADFDYDVPYYSYNGSSEFAYIYFGITDGFDPVTLSEYSQSGTTELDMFCAARAANDYWRVTLTENLPLRRHYSSNIKIETYNGTENQGLSGSGTGPSGIFGQTLWPIFKDQKAATPSAVELLGIGKGE